MKTLKSALIFYMVFSLVFWGYPVNAQQITDLSNNSATIIPAVTTSTTWVKPVAPVTIPNIAPTVATIPTVQSASNIQNFNISQVVQQLLSLKYGVTSDAAYTDLGSIQARQAEIFNTSSDCLDRAVYLLNLGNELGLDASISILYDSITGTGHALVGMDDGAGGRTMYDLTSDSGTVSLSDYVDKGFEVVAEVDSLEGLTTVVNGIKGAYNIAGDYSGDNSDGGYDSSTYSGDDAYGAMCADDNSWGTSSYDGGGDSSGAYVGTWADGSAIGSSNVGETHSGGGYGGSSDYSYYTDMARNVSNYMAAMNQGNWGGMMTATLGMAHDMSVLSAMDSIGSAGSNFATAMNNRDIAGMMNASFNMSHSMSTLSGLLSQSNSQNSWGPNANPVTSSITSNYGQSWGTASRNGNQLTITQNWVTKDGITHSADKMTGTIGQDGKYTLTDTKGNTVSSGVWTSKTQQTLLDGLADPGHQVISSPNGDKRDVDLKDGSYTITNGNQTLGSGSKGALNVNYSRNKETGGIDGKISVLDNLQVYAVDLQAGHGGVPQAAVSLISAMPGGLDAATHNTYIGSKNQDTTAYYQNVYTGKTVTVNDQTKTTPGQFNWVDASGQVLNSVNVTARTTTTQPKAADASAQKTVTLAKLESQLKTAASQQGSRVTSVVSSSGVTYTVWNETWDKTTSSVVISGKNDFTFSYDKQGNAVSGKVTAYDLGTGKSQSATIDLSGKYTSVPQAQIINEEQNRVATDPRALDNNNNVSPSQHTIEAQNQSFSKTIATLVPTIGLTDTVMTSKNATPEEIKDTTENKGFGVAQWFVDLTKATLPYTQGQNAYTSVTNTQVSAPVETKESNITVDVNKDNATPGILESLLSSVGFTGFGLTDTLTNEKNAAPQEIKDTTEGKSVNNASLLSASIEKLASFYSQAKDVAANGVTVASKGANTLIDDASGMKDSVQWATDAVTGFADLVGDTAAGLSDPGWMANPIGSFATWESDVGERAIEFTSDTMEHSLVGKEVKNELQSLATAAQPQLTFLQNTDIKGVNIVTKSAFIKADLGQSGVPIGEAVINDLEGTYGRPAVISALHDIGYAHMDGWTKDTLKTVVEMKLNPSAFASKPLAVVVYPLEDKNGFFSDKTLDPESNMPAGTSPVSSLILAGYNVQFSQAATDIEAMGHITEATRNAGKQADVIFIGGHGDKEGGAILGSTLFLGGYSTLNPAGDESKMNSLTFSLAPGGTVVLCTCDAGTSLNNQVNLANTVADAVPQAAHVYAPEGLAYGIEMYFDKTDLSMVHFGKTYTYDAATKVNF